MGPQGWGPWWWALSPPGTGTPGPESAWSVPLLVPRSRPFQPLRRLLGAGTQQSGTDKPVVCRELPKSPAIPAATYLSLTSSAPWHSARVLGESSSPSRVGRMVNPGWRNTPGGPACFGTQSAGRNDGSANEWICFSPASSASNSGENYLGWALRWLHKTLDVK